MRMRLHPIGSFYSSGVVSSSPVEFCAGSEGRVGGDGRTESRNEIDSVGEADENAVCVV